MHEPKSLFIDSPVRSKVSGMVSFARRARRVAVAVAVAGLLPLSEGSAQSAGSLLQLLQPLFDNVQGRVLIKDGRLTVNGAVIDTVEETLLDSHIFVL